jgi:2-polyprenyl-6-methoxyphenol hydroxylase-like FAD-dependent oxidoreductase
MVAVADRVLLCGAGPVGLFTALSLARSGVPVTVIEAEPQIIQSPRAMVYHSPTLEALDRLGALKDARAVGVLKQDYQYHDRLTDTVIAFDMSVIEQDTPYPYNLHLGQHVLAEIALKHLEKFPHANVRWNTRLSGIRQESGRVVAIVDGPDGSEEIQGAWLVGTDGAHSSVRRLLGLEFEGRTWPDRFVATNVYYDFEAHGYAQANFVLHPTDWAVIVKINNEGLWRVTYGEDADIDEAEVRRRAPGHYKRLMPGDEPYEITAISSYRVHNRAAEAFRVGRVLLAGDAAHVCNPIGGLGLTSGLLDGVAVADALAAVLVDGADETVVDQYAHDRRELFLSFTGPTSAENKRRLQESDPQRKQADGERLRRLQEEPAFRREMLLMLNKLAPRPYRRLRSELSRFG